MTAKDKKGTGDQHIKLLKRILALAEYQDVFYCSVSVFASQVPGLRRAQVPAIIKEGAKRIPALRNGLFTVSCAGDTITFLRVPEFNRHNTFVAEPVWNALRTIHGHPQAGLLGTVTIEYEYVENGKTSVYEHVQADCTVSEALTALVDAEVVGITRILNIQLQEGTKPHEY